MFCTIIVWRSWVQCSIMIYAFLGFLGLRVMTLQMISCVLILHKTRYWSVSMKSVKLTYMATCYNVHPIIRSRSKSELQSVSVTHRLKLLGNQNVCWYERAAESWPGHLARAPPPAAVDRRSPGQHFHKPPNPNYGEGEGDEDGMGAWCIVVFIIHST